MKKNSLLSLEFPDLELLQRFDVPGPRYTSYPTADRFSKDFGAKDFESVLAARPEGRDLSIYVHIYVFPGCLNLLSYIHAYKSYSY